MQRLLALIAAMSLGFAPAAVQAQADGGTESNLGLGASSRGIALGGAFIAGVDDASALYWNPSRLSALERGALMLTHASIGFGEATQTFAGLAYPTLGAGTFAFGMQRVATGGIETYDADSRGLGTIEFAETAFYASWGRAFSPGPLGRVELGLSAHTLSQSMGEWSATGTGLDAALAWSPPRQESLTFAVLLRDAVAPRVQLIDEVDRNPTTFQAGATWRPEFAARWGLAVHGAMDRTTPRGITPRLGIECRYGSHLALRLGASRQGMAFGVGLGWHSFGLDYAFLSQQQAGTHPVSLAAGWGSTRVQRVEERAAARAAAMRDELQSVLETRLASAQESYDRGDYAVAIDGWKVVIELDPTEERARRGLEAAGARLAEQQARALADRDQAAARQAQFELGLRAYSSSDHTLAREVWLRLLAEDPTNQEARLYLDKTEQALREQVGAQAEEARRMEAKGDFIAALAAWSRVHASDAHYPEAEPALARCRAALEKPRTIAPPRRNEPARERADTTARSDAVARSDHGTSFRDGVAAYATGDLERAIGALRAVRRDDPSYAEAQRLLAKAERASQPLGAEDRARVRELYLRGMGHFTAQQFEAAITEWSKILEIDPGNRSVYQNIREARARLRATQP